MLLDKIEADYKITTSVALPFQEISRQILTESENWDQKITYLINNPFLLFKMFKLVFKEAITIGFVYGEINYGNIFYKEQSLVF